MRAAVVTGLAVATLGLADPSGHGPAPVPVHRARYLMGTICHGTLYARDPARAAGLLEAAFDAIAGVESALSTWREDSELSRVNRQAPRGAVPISPEVADFLTRALGLAAETRGAFDPTVGALIEAWDLRGEGRVPSAPELSAAREVVGYRHVHLDAEARSVWFDAPGLWLDAGGLGKGLALDRAAQALRRQGVEAALLDFGGQLLAVGAPPGEEAWTVGVADPRDRDHPALILALRDASAATSAQSERGRQAGGRWVGHILDPRIGEPVERRGSVTVVAPSGAEADGLSTALFVLGPHEGLAYLASRGGIAVAFLDPIADGSGRLRLRANGAFHERLGEVGEGIALDPAPPGAIAPEGEDE